MLLRVVLDCQPPILEATLASAIERLPGITLIPVADGILGDVVITTNDAESGIPLYLLDHPMPDILVVVLDRDENILRLWVLVEGEIREQILPGDLATLFTILRGERMSQRA